MKRDLSLYMPLSLHATLSTCHSLYMPLSLHATVIWHAGFETAIPG